MLHQLIQINTNVVLGFDNLFGIVLSYDGPLSLPRTHPRGREL